MSMLIVASQSVADCAFHALLDQITQGRLLAGEVVRDQDLMKCLQVSRTPVREAMKRAESLGLVESYASRFTRVVSLTREEGMQEARIFASLHALLTTENWAAIQLRAPQLEALHRHYLKDMMGGDPTARSGSQWEFFAELAGDRHLPSIEAAITASTYRLRLAGSVAPEFSDPQRNQQLQRAILNALHADSLEQAHHALHNWAH